MRPQIVFCYGRFDWEIQRSPFDERIMQQGVYGMTCKNKFGAVWHHRKVEWQPLIREVTWQRSLAGGIWGHLASSGNIWSHLETSGVTWKHLEASGIIWRHLESPRKLPGDTKEAPRRQPGGTQEAPRNTQEQPGSPKRHPGDIQETPRRHPKGNQKTPRGTKSSRSHFEVESTKTIKFYSQRGRDRPFYVDESDLTLTKSAACQQKWEGAQLAQLTHGAQNPARPLYQDR